MAMTDNLKSVLYQHKELTHDLEKEIQNLEANDFVAENDALRAELSKCKAALDDAKNSNDRVLSENSSLKNSLYEQLYNEKIAMLNAVNKKIDAYYKANAEDGLNRLIEFEVSSKSLIDEMTKTLKQNRVELHDEIYKRLDELSDMLIMKVTAAREELARQEGAFSKNRDIEYEKLHQESITEGEMKSALKKNNIEALIGLNVLNKMGILFLIIGVIAASQFTYFQLPPMLKGIFAFLGGAVLLVIGEFLNRKKANVFSLGITSGGVAVLYVALAFSYFGLNIIGMYPALALCVIITTLAFVLSNRYNSQTIISFALVGGYLPIFSISSGRALVFSAMVYFIILNLLALIISFNKKWTVSAYIGFALNLVATGYIMSLMTVYSNKPLNIDGIITILYIMFTFVIYTLIPIMSNLIKSIRFKNSDIVLIAINTFVSAIFMYIEFMNLSLSDYYGILAIAFAAVYLLLGKFIDVRLSTEKKVKALFYLTGFTFVVLIIPFQFDMLWLSLGWLIEGVALVTYGILRNEKSFKKGGFIVCGLCLAAFLIFDVLINLDYLFAYKYFAITLGSLIIMSAYVYKKSLFGKGVSALKYCTAINIWLFMIYIIGEKLSDLIRQMYHGAYFSIGYLIAALCITVSFLIAYIIPRIKVLSDAVIKGISIFIYIASLLWLFILNSYISPIYTGNIPLGITIIGTAVLVVIGLLSVLAMRDLVKCLVMERKLGIEWYPLLVSAYFVIILTQNMITQYNLKFSNSAISIIYVIAAFSWIVFGFIKRYAFIRRFGLGLSILAVAKLFIIDLSFLSEGYRIVSYFAFGVTLLAISFVYQYFNKRLEVKEEVLSDVKKTNM